MQWKDHTHKLHDSSKIHVSNDVYPSRLKPCGAIHWRVWIQYLSISFLRSVGAEPNHSIITTVKSSNVWPMVLKWTAIDLSGSFETAWDCILFVCAHILQRGLRDPWQPLWRHDGFSVTFVSSSFRFRGCWLATKGDSALPTSFFLIHGECENGHGARQDKPIE